MTNYSLVEGITFLSSICDGPMEVYLASNVVSSNCICPPKLVNIHLSTNGHDMALRLFLNVEVSFMCMEDFDKEVSQIVS